MSDSVLGDPRIGSEIAGYRIERLLGRGGMSVVYLAHDPRLDRRVALKLLAPELSEDERFRERFLRESKLAASLDHPNVIPIFEAGEAEGVLFIAMRFVEGGDLKRLLAEEGPLEPARTVGILERVADALDAAHKRGLVHRDVKPGNVLISEDDHVYLSDFGLTKQAGSESGVTETGQFVGTADYVSPEQIEHQDVSGRTDEYALACVLYECLTGQAPFRGESLMGVLWGHMNRDATPASETNEELPSEIDAVLARGMAKQPGERYATCGELGQEAAASLGLSAEIVASGGVRGWSTRRWVVSVVVLVVVVAAAVVASVLVIGGDGGGPALSVEEDSLVRLDRTGEVTGAARVGRAAALITSDNLQRVVLSDGAVWVANAQDKTVTSIDADDVTFRRTVAVPGSPSDIDAGAEAIWVTSNDGTRGLLSEIDPDSGRVRRTIDTALRGVRFVVAADLVWLVGSDETLNDALIGVDPGTGEIAMTVALGARVADLVVAGGAVWVIVQTARVGGGGSNVRALRLDPASGRTVATVPFADGLAPPVMAVTEDMIWVARAMVAGGGSVTGIDLGTNAVVEVRELGDLEVAARFAVDDECFWFVTDTFRTYSPDIAEVLCVDRVSLEVVMRIGIPTTAATLQIEDIAIDNQSLWVTATPR